MDRCAVLVDAGWLLSEVAQAICGRSVRSAIECDYAKLAHILSQLTEDTTHLPLLRLYWYDAGLDGIPSADHLEIAALPNVKLRLGRISHREQKGVDALLILDLTTLARERAISSAVVISGDEDIRDGIAMAQSLGVRITLGSVQMVDGRSSQAATLANEADDQLSIDLGLLSRAVRTRASDLSLETPAKSGESSTPRQFGFAFGATYADGLTDPELRMLQREAPEVPAEAAAQLFREAEQVFGSTRGRPELRRELRTGFWDHVMQRRN